MRAKRLTKEQIEKVDKWLYDHSDSLYIDAPRYVDALRKCANYVDFPALTLAQFIQRCKTVDYSGMRPQIINDNPSYSVAEWDRFRRAMAYYRKEFEDFPVRLMARKLIESGYNISVQGISEIMKMQGWKK
jgi:hypothetical protein